MAGAPLDPGAIEPDAAALEATAPDAAGAEDDVDAAGAADDAVATDGFDELADPGEPLDPDEPQAATAVIVTRAAAASATGRRRFRMRGPFWFRRGKCRV